MCFGFLCGLLLSVLGSFLFSSLGSSGILSGLCISLGLCFGFLFCFFRFLFCFDAVLFGLCFLLGLESLFFSSLQGSFVCFGFGFNHATGLLNPLVSMNSTRVVLNRFIDVVFRITVELGQLCEGEDAQCVELLFTVRSNALDGLEIVFVLLSGGSNAVEINVLLSLLDAVDGLLLLGFCLDFIRFDGDAPKEVHAGLSKLETTLVGATFIGWEIAVIELEVDDNLSILTNGEGPCALFREGSFKHLESGVVFKIIMILHIDLEVTHVCNGDFFDA